MVVATEEPVVAEEVTPPPKARFPSEITLRAAVLHAPPFATVEQFPNGTVQYGGFQSDMLKRLSTFAAADNITLNWDLSVSLPQYGPSLDLVANDCHQVVANPQENCDKLDLIVGNYYSTPDRALRVDLSPAWLRSTISTIKYIDKTTLDFSTLSQAEAARAWVCLKDGTFYAGVVKAKFPKINYLMCPSQDDCLNSLKAEKCVLYASDELQLRYRAAWDASLEVTRESFNTQYIAWPRSYALDPIVSILLNRWVLAAVTNATLDDLYSQYFQKALCPVGTAGESCELPCDPDHGYADSRGVCVCRSTKWTGDDCSVQVEENTNLIPNSLLGMAYAMLGVNIIIIMGCGLWLIWQRQSTQVKVSQPFFLNLVLLGCLISSFTIVPLAQQDAGDGPVPACVVIPWLYSVGFSITFGTLFAKIRRVYIIFKSAIDMRRNIVTFKETFCVIGAVLAVDVTILIVWTVVDPLEWTRRVINADQFGEPLESVGYCNSEHWMIFAGLIAALHLGLMGTACFMCYVSRSIPTKFSEGKYVSIAMISNLQIFVVGVPILVMLGTDSQTGFFVRCVIIWMNDLAVVALIFGNLIYSVHWAPQDDEDKDVKAVVCNAVQEYSRNAAASSRMLSSRNMDTSYSRGMDDSNSTRGNRSSRFLDVSGEKPSSSNSLGKGSGNGSDHFVLPLPDPVSRKSSNEMRRSGDLRIPPAIEEHSASREGSSAEIGMVSRASIQSDVLMDKSSWAVVNTSSMFEVESQHGGKSRTSEVEDPGPPVKREDVLADNKMSWGGINLSTVLHDEEDPAEVKRKTKREDVLADNKMSWGGINLSTVMYDDEPVGKDSECSFADDYDDEENNQRYPAQPHLTPIAEDGLESLPDTSCRDSCTDKDKMSNSDPALLNFTSENETEETSGFFQIDDVSDVVGGDGSDLRASRTSTISAAS